jgi:hypothetical protein
LSTAKVVVRSVELAEVEPSSAVWVPPAVGILIRPVFEATEKLAAAVVVQAPPVVAVPKPLLTVRLKVSEANGVFPTGAVAETWWLTTSV